MAKLRLLHFARLFTRRIPLPQADIYVCSGNVLPIISQRNHVKGRVIGINTDPLRERFEQGRYMRETGSLRKHMANSQAPLILCRGRHDFLDLAPLADHYHYWEVSKDSSRYAEFKGVRFVGLRGHEQSISARSDATTSHDLIRRAEAMPEAEVIVAAEAPYGTLDQEDRGPARQFSSGTVALRRKVNAAIDGAEKKTELFLFSSEEPKNFSVSRHRTRDGREILCSNASGGYRVLERGEDKVWRVIEAHQYNQKRTHQ